MPRRSTQSRPRANGESLKEPIFEELCVSCSQIPFEQIFRPTLGENAFQYPLGGLNVLRERERTCPVCWFLTSIHDHILSPFLKDVGNVHPSRSRLYLVSNSSEKPWFDVAGTKAAELPQVPIAWLQVKQNEVEAQHLSEPYVCISRSPDIPRNADDAQSKLQFALPRKRLPNEALRGSVNYRLIQEWLDICEKTHTERCGRNSVSFKRDFLDMNLIDVQNGRIVPDIKSEPYIALSYVWGPDRANKSETTKPSGRKRPREMPEANNLYAKLPEHVPKTIKDAMEFVEQLGLKYLWVDCYCVDQLDYEAKQAQIENMHLVFECAYLTIVALDARNMEEGLSGLSRPFKYTYQPEVEVPSGRYLATFVDSIWDNQGNSPWDLRAWTLQEALVSRRCLYFDRSHVYMICAQEMFHDIMEADEEADRIPTVQSSSFYWQNGFDVILRDEIWSQTTYGAFVDCYTRRNLTFQGDALNACRAALTQMILATGVGFLWGLPLKGLARALLWKPDPDHCLQRRDFFPSWTWLGWVGRICYGYWFEETEDYAEEVETRVSKKKENNNIQHDRPIADSLFRHDVRQNDEAAIHVKRTTETDETRVLRISSTMARFDVKLVRHDEHRDSEQVNLGQEVSCRRKGDQWTLLNRRGETLVDEIGEREKFERTDYFFRLHPKASKAIQKTEAKNEFVFIKYWPAIRDHHKSNNWLPERVSALLVVKNKDGTYRREASVIMKCTDWLAARPIPRVIELR